MAVIPMYIQLNSQGNTDIIDITDQVAALVGESGLKNGIAAIFCPSSTSGLTTIEYEAGCLKDLRRLFDEITDPNQEYQHNYRWGDMNGYSHVRAALLGPSLSVPFVEGRLRLGTWQQIIYVDFDIRPRRRELMVQVIGE